MRKHACWSTIVPLETLSDLILDPFNANAGTVGSGDTLARSLPRAAGLSDLAARHGAARPDRLPSTRAERVHAFAEPLNNGIRHALEMSRLQLGHDLDHGDEQRLGEKRVPLPADARRAASPRITAGPFCDVVSVAADNGAAV